MTASPPSWWYSYRKFWQKCRQSTPFYHLFLKGRVPECLTITPTDPWPGDLMKGTTLLEGHFLCGVHVISFPQLWYPENVDPQHLTYLHSFSWLRDLRAVGDNAARRLARQLINHWIFYNRDWQSFSWQADILGQRIANWLTLYDFFGASADDTFHALFFKSLARQLKHLRYLYPLLQNPLEQHAVLKGLIVATITLPHQQDALDHYLEQFTQCIQTQIDAEGYHISRIPEHQLQLLKDLIDIRGLLRILPEPFPPLLQQMVEKITPTIRLLRHGDGTLALFGAPTSQASSADIDMALSLSDVKGRLPATNTAMGFIRLQAKNAIILACTTRQDSLTTEGYNDLNFEWSVSKERIIIQADLILEKKAPLTGQAHWQLHQHQEHQLLEGVHRTNLLTHRRQLYLSPSMTDIRGEELFEIDQAGFVKIRFVLHPIIKVALIRNGQSAVLQLKNGQSWQLFVSGATDITCEFIQLKGPLYAKSQTLILNIPLTSPASSPIKWTFRTV